MYIFPKNILSDASTAQRAFILQYADATFNPTTGAQTPAPILLQGPLNASTASIE
jgi:hypothetical protein